MSSSAGAIQQLTFVRPAVAKSSDRFVVFSVSSGSRNDGLQPLHSCPLASGWQLQAEVSRSRHGV